MKIRTHRLLLIFTILAVALAACGNGTSSGGVYSTGELSTPTPTPENKAMNQNNPKTPPENGPVSNPATSFGVSSPVRDLPRVTPQAELPPREINPQNTIPIKTVKFSAHTDAIPVKKPSKRKPSRRSIEKNKSQRLF